MKKLLILLALCMAFSVLLVACNEEETPEEPVEEITTEEETEAPTEKETEKTETESTTESTTEGTTEPVVEADPVTVIVNVDTITKMVNGADSDIIVSPEQYAQWEKKAEIDHTLSGLKFAGWVGFYAEEIGEFGYKINNEAAVYSSDFIVEAEKEVVDATTGAGAKSAARMVVIIPTAQLLRGDATIVILAKDAKGTEQEIGKFTITKTLPFEDGCHTDFALDSVLLNGEAFVKVENDKDTVAGLFDKLDNTVSVKFTGTKESVSVSGWVAYKNSPAIEFGYYLGDNYNIITNADFIVERPDLTETEATTEPSTESSESATEGTTAEEKKIENGMGYNVTIPINELTYGTYRAGIVAKISETVDGKVVEKYVQVFEFYVTIEYLGIDSDTMHITSVDTINGNGGLGEDGKYAPYFSDLSGTGTLKLDAAATGKTTTKEGLLTLNGWFGVSGGVNRYVWSIDGGKTWNDFTEGAKDGEPMDGFYHSVSNGVESTKNGLFEALTIDLSAQKGKTLDVWVGAVAELNLDDVIVICEISNLRVVETVAYDAANNAVTTPAGFVAKVNVSGVAGKILKIENAADITVIIDDLKGATTALSANKDGVISYELPEGLDAFDIVIENATDKDVAATITFEEPVVGEDSTATTAAPDAE